MVKCSEQKAYLKEEINRKTNREEKRALALNDVIYATFIKIK